jgi:hypothetical protein
MENRKMSRYDELCHSCEVMFKNYDDDRDRLANFLRLRFLPSLVRFLECSEDKIRLFDCTSGSSGLDLSEAMQSDAECYWVVGMEIRMAGATWSFDLGYRLRCRGMDGRFTVEIAERTFVIDNDADLERCFEHIFWHLTHYNKEGLHEAIRGGSLRRIGFSAQTASGSR